MAALSVDTSEFISRVVLWLKACGDTCMARVYNTHVLSVIAHVVP